MTDAPDVAAAVDVDGILDLPEESAAYDDGEPVDLLSHALQCAAILAESVPADLELQVAGLVHDLGHLATPGDDVRHASAGAARAPRRSRPPSPGTRGARSGRQRPRP